MQIEQVAEIAAGEWCKFVWDDETETIRAEWFSGKPPVDPSPQMRKRLNETLDTFMAAVRAECLKALIEAGGTNDD
jgi:hypothetical protein